MTRSKRLAGASWATSAVLAGLLLAAAVPAAGTVTARQDEVGAIRAVVSYRDSAGNRLRLAGVEVVLMEVTPTPKHPGPIAHPPGYERYACTNAQGVAVFSDVPTSADLWMVTGVGHPGVCPNAEYLNPSSGKKMLSVDWQRVYGGGQYTPFSVAPDETRTIRMMARTPAKQREICAGFYATWIGTPGDDVYAGTKSADVVIAGKGNDSITTRGGWDVVCAGPGNDVVHAGDRGDLIFGEEGNDLLKGQEDVDWIFGGPGTDTCLTAEFVAGCENGS